MSDTVRAAAGPLHRGNSVLPRGGNGRLADLAFGSLSLRADEVLTTEGLDRGRHLAFLPADALELDLRDAAQRQFGDYELLEQIGEGGMGVVYRARQISLDREVAVKLLSAGPWASRDFVDRFQREAQNAARMQHPNIVTIHEVGAVDEMHFFSMRLIRGSSLAQNIREGPRLTPQRVAALMRAIAEAVDYAHRLGVLHLDLKPANVLLDEAGEPHVADFGLARRLEPGSAADNTEVSGTPSYMAPEQATPGVQKITTATDIWGLGAILYELVTRKPPFTGTSAQATLKLVTEGQLRSPRRYVPDLPRDLEAIILKCMAPNVADRYLSARALADDLTRFTEGREVRARPLNVAQRVWRWARRQPYVASLGLLFTISMLAGIIGVTSQWKRAETNANRAEASATVSSERLWESRREAALRLQTDGNGFEALPGLIANIEEQEKAGKASDTSIERREIGMILSQGVTLIDRMILPDAHPLAAELSADGTILAIALGDMTVRWFDTKTLSERGRVDLSALPTSSGEEMAPRLLRFVDNKRLLVTLDWADYWVSPPNHDTYLIDLERTRVVEPPAEFADLADAVYGADGRFALLFDHHGGLQLWQVDPWRALSAKNVDERRGHGSWLLGRGGRFAIHSTGSNQVNLTLYDPRDLSAGKPMALPGFTFVTAWAEDSRGSQVAIGDSTGHAYVLDPYTGELRALPTPLGLEVKWMAFSEDDAWLAVVRRDGAAFAFDVVSGAPLNAGQMQQEFDVRQVAISHRERLVVASGFGETALWRLRKPGPTGGEATRLISRPTRSPHALTHAVGASLQTGLLVTTDRGGEVRLWRLPHTPDWPAFMPRAGINIPGSAYFDGEHLSDVAWNKVRIVSTRGAAPTPWVELPQPLAYAELLDGGRTLLATAGPAMYVFDAATMKPRYPAVPLPANPLRMAASADGTMAVFAFGNNGSAAFVEQLQAYDLESGQLRPGRAVVNGPLRQFELSPDAARLLTTGSPHGTTEVFASATLKRLGSYPHNPERPVVWASFTPGSERLWLLKRNVGDDDTAHDADLIAWDPDTNVTVEKRFIPGIFAVGLTAATGRPILATKQGLLDPDAANTHVSPGTIRDEATTHFAVSHDGRLLANVFGRDVQLYDAATLAAVGPPLRSYIGATDHAGQLAFSTDDSTLFGRKYKGLLWPVRLDTRPLAEIRTDAELLSPEPGGQRVLRMPSVEQSKRLRERDLGELPDDDARPVPPVARIIAGVAVPARDPRASPLLLDLTTAYTAAAESSVSILASVMPAVTKMPWGIAHLDGMDYDVRGIVELRQGSGHATVGDIQRHVPGIQVPQVPIAAFHVLVSAAFESPEPDERDYALIRLHYVDGSTAVLPIRTQRDVPGDTEDDKPVPIAFASGDHLRFIGVLKQTLINNPRLPNPHPERLIATLDLETASGKWAEPVFLAISAEPVIPAATGESMPNP